MDLPLVHSSRRADCPRPRRCSQAVMPVRASLLVAFCVALYLHADAAIVWIGFSHGV